MPLMLFCPSENCHPVDRGLMMPVNISGNGLNGNGDKYYSGKAYQKCHIMHLLRFCDGCIISQSESYKPDSKHDVCLVD